MRKLKIIFFVLVMCISFGYAHDADEAFFKISINENKTIIEAELPWSIRNVLIAYDSNYLRSKSKKETRAIFFKYAKEKLRLFNIDGEQLKLLNIEVVEEGERSSHSIKYILLMKVLTLMK